MKVFGLDVSLDHGGVVVLDENGKVIDYRYLTSVKKMVDVDPAHSIFLSKKGKDESKDVFRLRRMKEYAERIWNVQPTTCIHNSYYSIEGYSYASKSTSICQIAELTGYIKRRLFEDGGKIRIHEPKSVKLFATGKGDASKKEVVVHSFDDFPDALIQRKMIKKKGKTSLPPAQWWEEYDGPATDLADAYFLARMLYVELKLRSGEVTLQNLPENERRIFLRVTRAYPVNILDRQFICKGES